MSVTLLQGEIHQRLRGILRVWLIGDQQQTRASGRRIGNGADQLGIIRLTVPSVGFPAHPSRRRIRHRN